MLELEEEFKKYLYYCQYQKKLDLKTISAYRNDLKHFSLFMNQYNTINKESINAYLVNLHATYKQKSVKRKIASVKAFFSYLEGEEIISENPFYKVKSGFKEEKILPKTISSDTVQVLLAFMYNQENKNSNDWRRKLVLRDIVVVELLFSTGLRISELCNLRDENFDLQEGIFCIKGKGGKERNLQIGNSDVLTKIKKYRTEFKNDITHCGYFLVSRYGERFSEQSARNMLCKYVNAAAITSHITPHMLRHTFATLLLEEDVDIRYIQNMLGHSSILTTQIYTSVSSKKQKEILQTKHPRNKMNFGNKDLKTNN